MSKIEVENDLLGEGFYGQVFKGVWNGEKVAVKRIHQQYSEYKIREELVLQRLNHPNVIKLFHAENDGAYRCYAYELCEASLDQFFASKKGFHGVMPKPIVVFYQLATGLEFIHKMGLIHGDIKPQKVLIWVNPRHKEEILMKFSGFGFSQRVNETGSYSRSGTVETLDWLAPEILELHDDEKVGQNKGGACQRDMKKITRTHKSDVFAEGLLFGYFLLNGLHLFGSPVQRKPNILENKPVNLSKIELQYQEIIKNMLNPISVKRYLSSNVVQDLESIMAKERRIDIVTPTLADTNPKVLGKGGNGKILQGEWNEKQVAIKRIPINKVNKKGEEDLQKLVHPNVIKLIYVKNDDSFRCYHLELCETSLDKLFLADDNAKKYRGPAMPPDTEVLYQLAIGLEYIHQMELIHGNIKPENVLIHVDSTGKVTVKWADFGLSKSINQRAKSGATRAFDWLAPEILELLNNEEMDQSEEDVNLKQTEKSDVFAQGLLFGYYILKGRHLFGTPIKRGNNILSNNAVNLKQIQHCQFTHDLIENMLKPNPQERMTSLAVVQKLKEKRTCENLSKLAI